MEEEFEKLYHQVEKTNFWFKARRRYILDILDKYPRDISILDVGCSSGILLNELRGIGYEANNLYGVDISDAAIKNCRANGILNSFVVDAQDIQLEKKFDIVIASDCLEHLENDYKALCNWHSLLKAKGTLIVFVPAFMALWSKHDEVNMHFRRYDKKGLVEKLKKSGFDIVKSSYWNSVLFLPVLFVRLLSRLQTKSKNSTAGDLHMPVVLNDLLFHVINSENKLLKYINLPFGVSTFSIAKKLPLKTPKQPT